MKYSRIYCFNNVYRMLPSASENNKVLQKYHYINLHPPSTVIIYTWSNNHKRWIQRAHIENTKYRALWMGEIMYWKIHGVPTKCAPWNNDFFKYENNKIWNKSSCGAIFYVSRDFFLWILELPLKNYSKFTKACQKHLWPLSVIRTCTPIHVEGEKWPGWDLHFCY